MPRPLLHRRQRSRYLRLLSYILSLTLLIDTLSIISTHTHSHAALSSLPTPNLKSTKIFISSTHWNNEAILRSHWNKQILELASYFGKENIYVSVYESGSWDDSKGALRELRDRLEDQGVPNTVVLDQSTHEDVLADPPFVAVGEEKQLPDGWIVPEPGPKARPTELRRIPYLSRLRNLSLEPLKQVNQTFDKVLFLNDVVFTLDDILKLLATRDGEYAAACSLDFSRPPSYYDTFALRDSEGHEPASNTWPFFRSGESRNALLRWEPVPVKSCWNGVAVFDAKPFYAEGRGGEKDEEEKGKEGLRFRGISDTLAKEHLEGSECCLIHADNALSDTGGVWVNPAVRVGYSGEAYDAVHAKKKRDVWPQSRNVLWGVWSNRLRRWTGSVRVKEGRVRKRVKRWKVKGEKLGEDRVERGTWCLINEMQVLRENGWAHV